ncbi:response regulator [Desulforamulus hydrothermalis]|uniref:Stage 0 sporulation protein A homolog n=1 Tax=Desulforamulus hydrothermalis Lam5 = DSM 18033 TaxID=1121428 RepID=K8DXI6_9FIRM|nr:response regulator transcription factor [Desulforamulus hydrothermalis]CCO07299.1 DNA-binding transcriptional regulator, isolated component of a two-component regulator system [Desulforamulus hydrothermalis Lam5 = DSM 18033]SHG93503.1 two component transcriptional regulator, LuxR family [Desulforamulus hydrothermalis Lam5 = DSM 18033]
MSEKIRVMLADDHPVLRAGVKFLLHTDPQFKVVAEAGDGEETIRLLEQVPVDVLIIDLAMPRMGGLQCIKEIKARGIPVRIVVFSMYGDEHYIKEVMQAGALAYVEKEAVDTELLAAVKTAFQGQLYLNRNKVQPLLRFLLSGQQQQQQDPFQLLSNREREVLRLIVKGYSLTEIGQLLSLSVKTVETYKARLMQKLGFSRKNQLIEYAFNHGLLDKTDL